VNNIRAAARLEASINFYKDYVGTGTCVNLVVKKNCKAVKIIMSDPAMDPDPGMINTESGSDQAKKLRNPDRCLLGLYVR
jgi:hypothetical protein